MKNILAFSVLIISIVVGLYFGIWVLFIGGIADIVDQIQAPVMSGTAVGYGVFKMLCATVGGGSCVLLGYLAAIGILSSNIGTKKKKRG